MIRLLRLIAAAILLATSPRAQAAGHVPTGDAGEAVFFSLLLIGGVAFAWRSEPVRALRRAQARRTLRLIFGVPLAWLLIAFVHDETGVPIPDWVGYSLWLVLVVVIMVWGEHLVPARLRFLFALKNPDTHGSARFGTAASAARHLAPAAPADAFALGRMRDVSRRKDARFRHDGHILTCAPTGAGKGVGAVIPNLLDYPGSAFVLDLKGENYAVTARARRGLGQDG